METDPLRRGPVPSREAVNGSFSRGPTTYNYSHVVYCIILLPPGSLLKQASTEELLNDTESEYPKWSKANTRGMYNDNIARSGRTWPHACLIHLGSCTKNETMIDFHDFM